MSVYIPRSGKTYVYDFWLFGQHYRKSTGQTDLALAEQVERDLQDGIRRQEAQRRKEAIGAATGAPLTPRFTEWAGVYFDYVKREQHLRRPEAIEDVLRVLLRFCGSRPDWSNPKNPPYEGEPYHDLRLADFIDEPDWILKFEAWMDRRGISRTTKHHYRTYMSRMYKVAMLPQYRKHAQVKENPFAGIPRGKKVVRKFTLDLEQLRAAIAAMSYHVRLAVAIATLAPTLRLDNVLALRWDKHLDEDLQWISIDEHKTAGSTGTPKVAPITGQLRTILVDAKARRKRDCPFVVQYRGRGLKGMGNGIKAGFERAGIPYGRFGGATFHSIRHSISTLMPQLGVNPWLHRDLMGWRDFGTAAGYTHLQPVHLVPVAEQLSEAMPISDVVTTTRRRAAGTKATALRAVFVNPDPAHDESGAIQRIAGRRPGRPFPRKSR